MKVHKEPMSLMQKIIYTMCFIFLFVAFIYLGTRNYEIKKLSTSELFSKEYKNISSENNFEILSSYETLSFLEKGTGILFLGYASNTWCEMIAELLHQASMEVDFSPVYYFDFYEERETRHDNYLGILREIDDHLLVDDQGVLNLYAPTVVAVVKGDVVFFDDETSFVVNNITPKTYWNDDKKMNKIEEYKSVLNSLKEELK